MIYVALLRGINVGGKSMVSMAHLKELFARSGFTQVRTYINSGNVIFASTSEDRAKLRRNIETIIEAEVGFAVMVLLRSLVEIQQLVRKIPKTWANNEVTKCDVMFLDQAIDNPEIIQKLPYTAELEDLRYYPGAVVWRIDRSVVNKSKIVRIVGTPLYKQMTVRNPNTVRKLLNLMQEIADA